MSNNNTNTSKSKPTINDLVKRPLHKLFPNDPTKLNWSLERPLTLDEQMTKQRAMLAALRGAVRKAQLEEWKDAETNFEVDNETDDIEEMTELLDELNSRARGVLEARRIKIIRRLTGSVSKEEIDLVKLESRLSPEKLKQAITTGTVKEGSTVVSNGILVDGVEESTVAYLDRLIQQGKDEAKHRRDKAAANAAEKSRKEVAELEASF